MKYSVSVARKAESFSIQSNSYKSFDNYPGLILRVEAGVEEGVYTKYFDYGCVNKSFMYLEFSITEEDGSYVFKFNGHTLKDIDYEDSYTRVFYYRRDGRHAKYIVAGNNFPSNPKDFDECTLENGKQYTRLGNSWIDATGATA